MGPGVVWVQGWCGSRGGVDPGGGRVRVVGIQGVRVWWGMDGAGMGSKGLGFNVPFDRPNFDCFINLSRLKITS